MAWAPRGLGSSDQAALLRVRTVCLGFIQGGPARVSTHPFLTLLFSMDTMSKRGSDINA